MSIIRFLKKKINKIQLRAYKKRYGLKPAEMTVYLRKKEGIEASKNKIKHLFLGSSHCELGINTNLFEDYSAFNLGIGSQDLYQSLSLYKRYADYLPKLENVFLFYSVFSSGYEAEKTINSRISYYYNKVFDVPFKYAPKYGILSGEMKTLQAACMEQWFLPCGYTGYLDSAVKYDEKIANRDTESHVKNAFRANGQEKFVLEMYKIAKEKSHNLTVIIPPHSPGYRRLLMTYLDKYSYEYKNIFKPLFDIVDGSSIKIINLFEDTRFTDEDFYDLEHLNASGAIKLSKLLIEDIVGVGV